MNVVAVGEGSKHVNYTSTEAARFEPETLGTG